MTKKQWIIIGVSVGVVVTATVVGSILKKAADRRNKAGDDLGFGNLGQAGADTPPPQSVNEMPPEVVAKSKKVYLKVNGTSNNPVNVRYSPEVNNGWHNNIIHQFKNVNKGTNIGVFRKKVKDNAGHHWYAYVPNEPYRSHVVGISHTFGYGYIRDDVAYVK
jgi:hypothetical protein